jgi:hypothetical protein
MIDGNVIGPGNPMEVNPVADLVLGAQSIALTLNAFAVGSAPIPATAHIMGVRPVASVAIRIGFELPQADGAITGYAGIGDFRKGVPLLDAATWTWFNVSGASAVRTLYVMGNAGDVLEICFM